MMTTSLPVVSVESTGACADSAAIADYKEREAGIAKAEAKRSCGRTVVRMALERMEKALAYRHERAEWTLYFLAVSGLILWGGFTAPWSLVRWSMLAHIVVGVLFFPSVVLAFWLAHRSLLRYSRKLRLRVTGRAIEAILLLMTLSGFYLLIYGNPGNMLGQWMHFIHLWLTVLLLPLLVWHAFRWSVLRWRSGSRCA